MYWKKSIQTPLFVYFFSWSTITPQLRVVIGQEKKHKTSQISHQWRNKRKLFQKVRHGHYYVSSIWLRSIVAYFSHWDDQDSQNIISILFSSSASCLDHNDVFLVCNFHLDEQLGHVAQCQFFMTWHPYTCWNWHKTLDKIFETRTVNQAYLDWNNATSWFWISTIFCMKT